LSSKKALYFYVVSFLSLAVLAIGLVTLVGFIAQYYLVTIPQSTDMSVFNHQALRGVFDRLAVTLVGGSLFACHWMYIQKHLTKKEEEVSKKEEGDAQ